MAQLVHSHPQMMILPAATNPNAKDSRWLTLEVCREFQRSKCSRSDNECKFAHPPPYVEVQNGRVIACFDSIKGKCQRKDPPCKYLHPPQHLREQLLQNGRNNLILKNLQFQAYQQAQIAGVMPVAGTKTVQVSAVMPGQYSYLAHPGSSQAPPQAVLRPPTLPPTAAAAATPSPYDATHYPGLQTLSAVPPQAPTAYNPYIATSLASVAMPTSGEATPVMSQPLPPNMLTKAVRADKFETSSENGDVVTSHASLVDTFSYPSYYAQPTSAATLPHHMVFAKKRPRDPADDLLLQSTMPGMVPAYKRIAVGDISKGGIPVYQTNPLMSPLQHTSLMQLQQPPSYLPMSFTGHPPSVPRF